MLWVGQRLHPCISFGLFLTPGIVTLASSFCTVSYVPLFSSQCVAVRAYVYWRVQAGFVKKTRNSKCHMTALPSNPNARMNTKSKRWRLSALKSKSCSRLFQGILVQEAVASNACFGDVRSSYYGVGEALRCMPRRRCPNDAVPSIGFTRFVFDLA